MSIQQEHIIDRLATMHVGIPVVPEQYTPSGGDMRDAYRQIVDADNLSELQAHTVQAQLAVDLIQQAGGAPTPRMLEDARTARNVDEAVDALGRPIRIARGVAAGAIAAAGLIAATHAVTDSHAESKAPAGVVYAQPTAADKHMTTISPYDKVDAVFGAAAGLLAGQLPLTAGAGLSRTAQYVVRRRAASKLNKLPSEQ